VGETVARKIAAAAGNIQWLEHAGLNQLQEIEEVGQIIAASILDWFSRPQHKELIQRLQQAGLKLELAPRQFDSDLLNGKTLVITGTFAQFSREEIRDMIERNGGKNGSSVGKSTHYLVAGAGVGPAKMEKAVALGVQVISEEEFLKMIGHGGK
jgi:DNA ligase (NAD+)